MPILKNVEIGVHRDCTQINFGFGDVSIATGEKQGNEKIKVLVLSQHEPKPIEQWDHPTFKAGTITNEMPGPIVELTFTRKESVKNLIDQLQAVYNDFN